MPRVPRLTNQSVRLTPTPMVQTNAEAEGAPLARVAGQLGQVIEQEVNRAREVQVTDALVRLRSARDRALYDPKNGVLNRRMADALDTPKAFQDVFAPEVSAIAASIRDPEARRAFEQRAAQERVEAEGIVLRHVDAETERLDAVRSEERAQQLADDIINGNESKLAEWEATLRGRLDRQGLDAETIDARIARGLSGLRLAQIDQLAQTNPSVARETLDRYADQLQGKDLSNAQRIVRAGTLAVESQAARDALVAEFPDNEAEALQAVRDRYEGEMEDKVRERVEAHFADKRRLEKQVTTDLYNEVAAVAQRTGDTASIAVKLEELRERDPALAARVERLARQTRTGEAAETDWNIFWPLINSNVEVLREVDPLQYKAVLAPAQFNTLVNVVTKARQTGAYAQQAASLNEGQVLRETFTRARADGLLPQNVTSPNQLSGENGTRFTQLTAAVNAELATWSQNNGGRTPDSETQRTIIQRVLDDRVLETSGWNSELPRAMVLADETSEELTGAAAQRNAERITTRAAQELRNRFRAQLTQGGFSVTEEKVNALITLYADPNLTPAQKETAALAIARGR